MSDQLAYIKHILESNKDKSFVQRILRKDGNYPKLDLGNGQHATHRMAWTEADGKYHVYPTVLLGGDGNLKEYDPKEAWKHVRSTNNYITFDDPDMADWFSQNYKMVWGR